MQVYMIMSFLLVSNTKAGTYTNKYYEGVLQSASYSSAPNGITIWSFTFDDVYTISTRTINSTHMEFKITAKTTGFIGFGLGPKYNTVTASDFVIGGIEDATNKTYNYDMYGDEISQYLRKDVKVDSDWVLIYASQDLVNSQTNLTFQRCLKTIDPNLNQDIEITNTAVYVLWFIGENDTITTNFTHHDSSMSCNLLKDGTGNAKSLKGSVTAILTISFIVLKTNCFMD